MLLNIPEIETLHKKYAPNQKLLELVFTHCKIVNEVAQWCAGNIPDKIDAEVLQNICLLHDIGTYAFFDEQGNIVNHDMYPQHAIIGAKLLQDEGLEKPVWQAVETHLLMGLSKSEITGQQSYKAWPLPARDYFPQTIEAELLCYADRFHSKRPVFNSYSMFLERLESSLPIQAEKFKLAAKRFGLPNIETLADKYSHPID